MASMLPPAMSDQDLLGAMISHFEPRIQTCLISPNLKSTQEAHAFLTKLQSLKNSREQYRSARRDFEPQDQNRRTPRDQTIESTAKCRSNSNVQERHVRRDGRDRNSRGDSIRNPRLSQGQRSFYGRQGRPNDGNDSEINAAAEDFIPGGNQRRNGSRSHNENKDRFRSSNLNA
jgi:hypothetical protein